MALRTVREGVRIYDKARFLKLKGSQWWRVESQRRFSKYDTDWLDNPFTDLSAIEAMSIPESIRVQDEAMLYFLKDNPEAWGRLAKDSRAKFKLLTKELGSELDPSPSIVFNVNKAKLQNSLETILSPCQRSNLRCIFMTKTLEFSSKVF